MLEDVSMTRLMISETSALWHDGKRSGGSAQQKDERPLSLPDAEENPECDAMREVKARRGCQSTLCREKTKELLLGGILEVAFTGLRIF